MRAVRGRVSVRLWLHGRGGGGAAGALPKSLTNVRTDTGVFWTPYPHLSRAHTCARLPSWRHSLVLVLTRRLVPEQPAHRGGCHGERTLQAGALHCLIHVCVMCMCVCVCVLPHIPYRCTTAWEHTGVDSWVCAGGQETALPPTIHTHAKMLFNEDFRC